MYYLINPTTGINFIYLHFVETAVNQYLL